MQYNSVLECLQNLISYKPTQAELCQILNMKQSTMSNRAVRNSSFNHTEIETLEKHYGVMLNEIKVVSGGDRVEINYWDQLPDELKNPKIVSCWFDREIIENSWGMSAEHLCIVPMVGDKMSRYWYPIRNGDILIIDTAQDHIMGNGVYFGTSQNNSRFWVREMQVLINRKIEFSGYAPSGETKKVYTAAELEAVDFKLIGKVVKNVSFRL